MLLVTVWAAAGGGVAEEGRAHWAFLKPQPAPVPAVNDRSWCRTPIDAFVLARLENEGIKPSPEADRRTLIRRLSFDLLGLPPSPSRVSAFVEDVRPDAYEQLVAELLASPHFGEQWGRHWLDLARYADSDGYEKDKVRPHAWRFRDWVIAAINEDTPFDTFTLLQLAGDLLPDAGMHETMATGFHRNTLTNTEGGVDQEEFRCKAVVDRVSTTGTVWLGLTLGCAECHTHKYDPITQHEFFQMFAFFNQADEVDLPAPLEADQAAYLSALSDWERERDALERRRGDSGSIPSTKTSTEGEPGLDEALKHLERRKPKPPESKAQTLGRTKTPRPTHVHVRGDFLRKGDLVEPGTPAILHPLRPRGAVADRLDLARWLVDPANPLTARVSVNHVWRHLFGKGLVVTPSDFGTRGQPPTHPALLDWLGLEFMRLGWSRKSLIELIVTSSTYRQSSWYRSDLMDRDPLNQLLARQHRHRLSAENVRDTCLAVSGLLNPSVGGPGVRPPLPADIAALGYANSVQWTESPGGDRYRRGLYIHFQRTVPYPMLMTFDAPDSNVSCTRRERSNTPLQALALLNDPVFVECAVALGRRVAREEGDLAAQVRRLFELSLGRPPDAAEQTRLETLFRDQWNVFRNHPEEARRWLGHDAPEGEAATACAALSLTARVVLNLDECVTRE